RPGLAGPARAPPHAYGDFARAAPLSGDQSGGAVTGQRGSAGTLPPSAGHCPRAPPGAALEAACRRRGGGGEGRAHRGAPRTAAAWVLSLPAAFQSAPSRLEQAEAPSGAVTVGDISVFRSARQRPFAGVGEGC